MTASRPDRLRFAAQQIRAGVLRGAIDRTLLITGIENDGLRERLRNLVTPAETRCARALEEYAAEIEAAGEEK
ncbi:MAG: hypothetical protein AB7H90_01080 [Alphaproteobacteria bacterium]